MQLTASDFYTYYRPEKCAGRVFMREQDVPEAEPSAYDQVLARLGLRHEKAHLDTLGAFTDLSDLRFDERFTRTTEAIKNADQVIYQPAFRIDTQLNGVNVTIVGNPDFLLFDGHGYSIRDSKLSRQIDEDHHIEITLQLQLYGWLYEKKTGNKPIRLEVHNGKNEISEIPYDGGVAALAELTKILAFKVLAAKPYEPVGWSKCGSCGYGEMCIARATEEKDVAIVMEVDQGLARPLHSQNVESYPELLKSFDAPNLSELKRPWGERMQKVGKKAEKIMLYAGVMQSGKEQLIAPPAVPDFPNYVMFDLEGLPPEQDELEKIYLWGTQVYGEKTEEFLPAVAGFGDGGDRQGWLDFLRNADSIFAKYGDIPFVHWHHYERVNIDKYIARYGDPDGIAVRVKQNLLDLLPITKASVALPIPSYSLKVVEKYVGFKRTQEEYGGDWSMAMFIEATETNDEQMRNELMAQILKYNEEDLAATWAVLQWLKTKMPQAPVARVQ